MSSIQTHFFTADFNSQKIEPGKAEKINSAKLYDELKTESEGQSFGSFLKETSAPEHVQKADDNAKIVRSDSVKAFLDYMTKSPAEIIREAILAQEGLTEEELARLSPEERAEIEEKIQKKIEEKIDQQIVENSTSDDAIV